MLSYIIWGEACMCHCVHAEVKYNLWEQNLFFHHMLSRDGTHELQGVHFRASPTEQLASS